METILFIVSAVICSFTGYKINNKLAGKRIAVLGATAVGKTTLFLYLKMLSMKSTETKATRNKECTEKTGEIDIQIGTKSVCFRIHKTVDMPGDEEHRNLYWENLLDESDTVLYLVHAYNLLRREDKKEETENRIESDLKKIVSYIKQKQKQENENIAPKKSKNVIIIGNHFDEIDENFMLDEKINSYTEEFKNNTIIKIHGQGMHKLISTFKDIDNFRKTMRDIYNIIESNSYNL